MEPEKFQQVTKSRLDSLTETSDRLAKVLGVDDDLVKAADDTNVDGSVMDRIDDLEAQMNRIESQLEAIQDLGREKSTKEEKIARLVQYAQNLSNDGRSGRILLKAKDIKGTAGVSRRYAYDLMDELPEKYEWALNRSQLSQYGDLEIDKDGQDRALVIDLDALHTDDEAVNKFTTRTTTEGASA